jgi:type IV fimbrial biogenesis protein FimT
MLAPLKFLHRSRGLTLIEVALAIAVLGILSGLAVPAMGAYVARQRVHAAADALAADLNNARFEAAQHGRALFVDLKPGVAWCWSVAAAAGCDCGQPTGCALHSVSSPEHRGVRVVEGFSARLEPTGIAQQPQAAVLESARGERLRVELSALGRTRVCAPGGGNAARVPGC